ncbi:MAG: pyruvate ferredoxin oxidoreductase [Actinobacteria bacterium]|nr:pyruvate ferredoxin oxidoreductase [Actinomycetota bacterium]
MDKQKVLALTGNQAVAHAMKQINPDVVAAYPITPQTTIMEEFSNYVANGLVDTELVRVESEHSAMSAVIGSAAAGARSMTATSAQGLALMWEELYIASGLRLPIVLVNVNRALSAPINIHCDHSDAMGARDSGWIMIFNENAQEAYDATIMAFKIAENERVFLPVMINFDGFTISHSIDAVSILDDDVVKNFVGDYKAPYNMLETPTTVGAFDSLGGFYYEFKKVQEDALRNSLPVIQEVYDRFAEISGRHYRHLETEFIEDAEIVFVIMGSLTGSVREIVHEARRKGIKAGLLKVRTYRPFPEKEVVEILKNSKAIVVFDRANSPGASYAPLCSDITNALYKERFIKPVVNVIYGLGGRDLELEEIEEALKIGIDASNGKEYPEKIWISIKGKEVD